MLQILRGRVPLVRDGRCLKVFLLCLLQLLARVLPQAPRGLNLPDVLVHQLLRLPDLPPQPAVKPLGVLLPHPQLQADLLHGLLLLFHLLVPPLVGVRRLVLQLLPTWAVLARLKAREISPHPIKPLLGTEEMLLCPPQPLAPALELRLQLPHAPPLLVPPPRKLLLLAFEECLGLSQAANLVRVLIVGPLHLPLRPEDAAPGVAEPALGVQGSQPSMPKLHVHAVAQHGLAPRVQHALVDGVDPAPRLAHLCTACPTAFRGQCLTAVHLHAHLALRRARLVSVAALLQATSDDGAKV
mmetsp:Transcript_9668/g.27235  ORF Transcript_9668/g.27235 Transcript_9668/m.27235 type:complete len:298 (+) Transcript_9668:153-1046(+)